MQRHSVSVSRTHQNRMDLLRRYKAKIGCSCGERRPECLDLHHRDPSTKSTKVYSKGIGKTTWKNLSYKELVLEVAKCEVICSNSHRALHIKFKGPAPDTKANRKRLEAEMALGLI